MRTLQRLLILAAGASILFSVTAAAQPGHSQSAPNLIPNGGFEDPFEGEDLKRWRPGAGGPGITMLRTDAEAFTGTHSLYIGDVKGTHPAWWISPLLFVGKTPGVVPGEAYTLLFRIKTRGLHIVGERAGGSARVAVQGMKRAPGKNERVLSQSFGKMLGSHDWTVVEGDFVLPEGTDYIFVEPILDKGVLGDVWIDDVRLLRKSERSKWTYFDRSRYVFLPRTRMPPQIDGDIEDAAWGEASQVGLTPIGEGAASDGGTRVRALRDDAFLYVAFDCPEAVAAVSLGPTARKNEGAGFFHGSTVEVFIEPTPQTPDYFQFCVNPAGGSADLYSYDAADHQIAWEPPRPWRSAVRVESGRWTAEMAIPFEAVAASPRDGATWRINFCHTGDMKGGRLTSWQALRAGYHEPEKFGRAVFAPRSVFVAGISPGGVEVENLLPSAQAVRVTVEAVLPSGKTVAVTDATLELPKMARRLVPLDYPVTEKGAYRLSCRIWSEAGVSLSHFEHAYDIPDLVATLEAAAARLDAIAFHSPELRHKAEAVREEAVAYIERLKEQEKPDLTDWLDDVDVVEQLEHRVTVLATNNALLADAQGRGYAVAAATSLDKLQCEFEALINSPRISPRRGWTITGARNEWESFQLVLLPLEEDLKDVRVLFEDLADKNVEQRIESDRLSARQVGYVKTSQPYYSVERVGWWPDPLLEKETFDISREKVEPLWITIHIPEDAPAGSYGGDIVIRPANAPEARFPLTVTVFDFAVPRQMNYKVASGNYPMCPRAFFYNDWGKVVPVEDVKRWVDFYLRYRLSPEKTGSIYVGRRGMSFKHWEEQKQILEYCIAGGANVLTMDDSLAHTLGGREHFTQEQKDRLTSGWSRYCAFMRERGWLDRLYYYGSDEPTSRTGLLLALEENRLLKSVCPEVKVFLTKWPSFVENAVDDFEAFDASIDVWVPPDGSVNEGELAKLTAAKQRGKEIWWYRNQLNVDWPALSQRNTFGMLSRKYGFSGFLFWSTTRWRGREADNVLVGTPLDQKWPNREWNPEVFRSTNGNGYMVYPGPDRTFWASVRLEAVRDGIEDWEYLHLLERLLRNLKDQGGRDALVAETEKVLAIPRGYEKTYRFEKDSANIERLFKDRQTIARQIEKLQ